jgi:predicted RNase H-like HicB family nuclease
MVNQFHAIFEQDGDWVIGFCPEIPGANGMGKTQEECKENLADAIRLILLDRYEDSVRGLTDNYVNELITVQ